MPEEQKEKIRKANKGQIPWSKGKKLTKDQKKNMSGAQKLAYSKLTPEEKEIRKEKNRLGHLGVKPNLTEQARNKKREQMAGNNYGSKLKGIKHSEEHTNKIAEANKKFFANPLVRQEISERMMGNQHGKGKVVSIETKSKIGAKNKVNTRKYWDNMPPEEKEKRMNKLIKSNTGRKMPEWLRLKMSRIHKNKVVSKETREKISKNIKEQWRNKTSKEKKYTIAPMIKAALSMHMSSLEISIKNELDLLGINYVQQKEVHGYYADFYLPESNLLIEVDGCYWHGCDICGFKGRNNKQKEANREKRLLHSGYDLIRIKEHDIEMYGAKIALKNAMEGIKWEIVIIR